MQQGSHMRRLFIGEASSENIRAAEDIRASDRWGRLKTEIQTAATVRETQKDMRQKKRTEFEHGYRKIEELGN